MKGHKANNTEVPCYVMFQAVTFSLENLYRGCPCANVSKQNSKAKHERQNAIKCNGSAMGSSGAPFTSVDHG